MFKFTQLSYEMFGGAEESAKVEEIVGLKNEVESTQKNILLEDIRNFVYGIYLDNMRENNKLLEDQIRTQKLGNESYQQIVETFNEFQTNMWNIFQISLKIIVRHQNNFFVEYYRSNFQTKFEHDYEEMENNFKETKNFYNDINIVKENKQRFTEIGVKKTDYGKKSEELYNGSQSLDFLLHETKNQMNKAIVNVVEHFKIEKALNNLNTKIQKKKTLCLAKENEFIDLKNKNIMLDNNDEEDISFLNKLTFDINELKSYFFGKEINVISTNQEGNLQEFTNSNKNNYKEIKKSLEEVEVNLKNLEELTNLNKNEHNDNTFSEGEKLNLKDQKYFKAITGLKKSEVEKVPSNKISNSKKNEVNINKNEKNKILVHTSSFKGSHKILRTPKQKVVKMETQGKDSKTLKKINKNEKVGKNIKQLSTAPTAFKVQFKDCVNTESGYKNNWNKSQINEIKNGNQGKNNNVLIQIVNSKDDLLSSSEKNASKGKVIVSDNYLIKNIDSIKFTKKSLEKAKTVRQIQKKEIQNKNNDIDHNVDSNNSNFELEGENVLRSPLRLQYQNKQNEAYQNVSLAKACEIKFLEKEMEIKNFELGSQSAIYCEKTKFPNFIPPSPSQANLKENLKRNLNEASFNENLLYTNKKLKTSVVNPPINKSLPKDVKFKSPKNVNLKDLSEENKILENINIDSRVSKSESLERKIGNTNKIKINELEPFQILKNNLNFDLNLLDITNDEVQENSNKSVKSLSRSLNLSFNFVEEDKPNIIEMEKSIINCDFFDSEQKSKTESNESFGNSFNFINKNSSNLNAEFNFEGFYL